MIQQPELTADQSKRYRRQLILKEFGTEGQKKLAKSKVLIVGAGGLGSPIALYLAAAGIGHIGIADFDIVDLSNLQRQIIHSTNDIGRKKAVSAGEKMVALNPEMKVVTHLERLGPSNIKDLVKEYNVVINATDSIETRYELNDACCALQVPLIEGAVYRFEGYVMTIIPGSSACYRCTFPDFIENKEEIGVIGVLPGVIGTLQAMEAIKLVSKIGTPLQNSIIYYNALDTKFRQIQTSRDPECPACSKIRIN